MTNYKIWPKSKFIIREYLKFKLYFLTSSRLEKRLEKINKNVEKLLVFAYAHFVAKISSKVAPRPSETP